MYPNVLPGSIIYLSDINTPDEKIIKNIFPESLYKSGNFLTSDYYVSCSDPFWSKKNIDIENRFFFSFLAMPVWIEEAVDNLNKCFENIKIEVHKNKIIKNVCNVSIPVFSVKYADDYNVKYRKFSNIIIHHTLRMFSFGQNIESPPFIKNKLLDEYPKNLPKFIEELNNLDGSRYWRVCELDLEFDDILNIDNKNLMDSLLSFYSSIRSYFSKIKQTEILLFLKEMKWKGKIEPKFNVGDLVVPNREGEINYPGLVDAIRIKVTETNVFGNFFKVKLSVYLGCEDFDNIFKTFFFEKKG